MFLPSSSRTEHVSKTTVAIASYKDPYYKYYRQVIRILLAFVLPAVVTVILVFLIISFVGENIATQPTPTDTYIFNNVPVPPGSIAAPLNSDSASLKATSIEHAWVPNYNADSGPSQAFLVNVPQGEPIAWADNYYQQKLKANKKWQLQQNIVYKGKVTLLPSDSSQIISVVEKPIQGQALYVQGINGQAITGLFIDYRLLTATELHDYPGEYGSKAKDGQIYLVITKNIMHRGF